MSVLSITSLYMLSNQDNHGLHFFNKVYDLVRRIPRGKVASYGQIASLISTPRAARIVGFAMRKAPDDVPWQRVISSSGRISIENVEHPAEEQAALLRAEGVVATERLGAFYIDMREFGWKK